MKEINALDIVTTEENEKIFFSFEVDLEANEIFNSKINPTEVKYEKVEWLYASNNKYPEGSINHDKVGKWMLFIKPKWVNQVWGKIKSGIAKGELWDSKVTTNNPNRRFHAIMIYTKDYTNLEDVIRVLDYLERTQIKPKNINLRYKADWQTRAGIYSGGKKRPWIYASESVRDLVTSNASQSSNVVVNDQHAHSPSNNPATVFSTFKPKQRSNFSLTHAHFFQLLAQEDNEGKEEETIINEEMTDIDIDAVDYVDFSKIDARIKHGGFWMQTNPMHTSITVPTKDAKEIIEKLRKDSGITSVNGEMTCLNLATHSNISMREITIPIMTLFGDTRACRLRERNAADAIQNRINIYNNHHIENNGLSDSELCKMIILLLIGSSFCLYALNAIMNTNNDVIPSTPQARM